MRVVFVMLVMWWGCGVGEGVEDVRWEMYRTLKGVDFRGFMNGSRVLRGTECGVAMDFYFKNLVRAQWAQYMFDSNAKIPEGILAGNFYSLGQYDECVNAVQDAAVPFVGKYCLMELDIGLGRSSSAEKSLATSPVLGRDLFAIPRLYYGVCVPSSCSAEDVTKAMNEFTRVIGLLGVHMNFNTTERGCSVKEETQLGAGEWAVIGFMIVLGVIAVGSTFYDVRQRLYLNNSKPHPLLSSFSIYTNGRSILHVSHGPGQMGVLHGLRVLSMMWVVLGHAFEHAITYSPVVNLGIVPHEMVNPNKLLVSNSFVSVDTFFFLSGLLVCFVFFRDMKKNGTFDVPLSYIHRYLRLTPPYAMIILLQVTLLLVVGDGPIWNRMSDGNEAICQESWWGGLLYIQNFIKPESNCLAQSWYLGADMQMYWVSPLLLYPMYLFPKAGLVWFGLVLIGCVSATFGIAMAHDLGPSVYITRNPLQYKIDYDAFYTRATPYIIGIGLAYLMGALQARKIKVKLSKGMVFLGWSFSTLSCLTVIYSYLALNSLTLDYRTAEAALYLSLHRVAWALGLSWIVFACLNGYGGPVNAFLSWGPFQPLGKLSYSVYLIHMAIQNYRASISRTNVYLSDMFIIYNFIGDWVLANLLGFVLSVLIELPSVNVERYLTRDLKILPYPRPKPKQETRDVEGVRE